MSLSRSNQPLKELFTGMHLVIIADVKPLDNSILVRFSDGHNKSFDKFYSMDSEFIKMCGDAGTITETSVFDDKASIGKRLWIAIKEVWSDAETVNFYIFDTFRYVAGMDAPKVKDELFREGHIVLNEVPITATGDFKVISQEGNYIPLDFSNAKPMPKILDNIKKSLPSEKAKIIAEQRAMMEKVISKPKEDLDIM